MYIYTYICVCVYKLYIYILLCAVAPVFLNGFILIHSPGMLKDHLRVDWNALKRGFHIRGLRVL